jgi:hypothetical protein
MYPRLMSPGRITIASNSWDVQSKVCHRLGFQHPIASDGIFSLLHLAHFGHRVEQQCVVIPLKDIGADLGRDA